MPGKTPEEPEEVVVVHSDDGDPTTPDDFVVTGAEGLSSRDIVALVANFQAAISGLNAGMSTITTRMDEVLGQEEHHRVMQTAMSENVEAWTHVARALSPGSFTLPREKAAVLEQVRDLVLRGNYSFVPVIPRVRSWPDEPTAVGVVK